jgi:hypothetical protein
MTGLRAGFVFRRPDPTAFIAAVRWAEQERVQTAWTTQGGIAPDALAMFAVAATQTERTATWWDLDCEPCAGVLYEDE